MPEDKEPATSPDPSESDQEPDAKKRSGTVSLVLIAGCGALAYQLARLDPSQREEEVRVYPDLQACIDAHLRSASDCRTAYATALDLYPRVLPEYDTFMQCEIVHGGGGCRFDIRDRLAGANKAIPSMTAFVVGTSSEQDLPPQPAFAAGCNSPGLIGDRDALRYVTGSGALLEEARGGGSAVAYGNVAQLRAEPDTLRKTVFGGFGRTGRRCVYHASGGG